MSETMRPPCDVKALYQYTSEHEDDLNFEVGQIIHVHAEEDDEWLNGSYINAKGDRETGIFPKSFVELVETPKAPARPSRTGAQKETHIGLDKETQLSNLTDTNPAETQGSEGLHTTSTKAETSTTDSAADVGARGPDSVEVASQFPVNETRTSSIRDATAHGEEDPQPKPAPVKYTSSVESAPQHTTEPPSTHEKVPKSNAFRDRIAAFNKQGAAPVAPKPMAKPSLAKKPFVAPPPSKDSYVPATTSKPKPTAIAPESHIDELAHGQVKLPQEIAHESTGPEAPPKVGSLKDRIAALQAERSHVAAKKAGAKEEGSSKAPVEPVSTQSGRPAASDRRENAPETNEDLHDFVPEQGELSRSSTIETTSTQQRPLVPEVPQEEYSANPHSPLLLSRERTTTSIDSLQPQQTGASTHSSISLSKPVIPVIPMQNHPREDVVVDSSDHIDNEPTHEPEPLETVDQNSIAAPESSEDEIDEEEQRKQQLRARMAKMSGGMGMGMHMALGIGGNNATRSTKPKVSRKHSLPKNDTDEEHQALIPMPGLPSAPSFATTTEAEHGTAYREPFDSSHSSTATEPQNAVLNVSSPTISQGIENVDTAEEHLDRSIGDLSLVAERSVGTETKGQEADNSQPLSPTRGLPPPVPGGRPTTTYVSPQPRSEVSIVDSQGVSIEPPTSPPLVQSPHASIAAHSQEPYQAPSAEFTRSPPPVPTTFVTTRTSIDSPRLPAISPQYTPGGSKRMSYFGAVTSTPSSRPIIESDARDSIDHSRSSFDTLSRTNSARTDAPARPPPPPSIPVSRAPPPPVPSTAPPARIPAQPPTRMVSIPEPSHTPTQDDFLLTHAAIPAQPDPHSSLLNSAATESEKEGYDADDDETDAQSLNRPSTSGPRPSQVVDSTPQSAAALERSSTKKKGIKGLFKRKDK